MLISSRTPLRVSFFGGGTDYPEYYRRHRGAVVGMAINRYVYISALRLDSFLEYKYRVSYSRLEMVQSAEEVVHPVVREVLRHYRVQEALDINVMADLPARSGLGSSSAFTVGFINLVASLQGRSLTKLDLAREAIHVEQELLRERVGVQDQFHASFGGLNRFDFEDGRVRISPVQISGDCLAYLSASLLLLYTGLTRYASETLDEQMALTQGKKLDAELQHLLELTDQAMEVLEGSDPERMLNDLGRMMHEGWLTKRRLSSRVSSSEIDQLYEAAMANGALGGKLCGAGGGGFLLMVVPSERQQGVLAALPSTQVVRLGIDPHGSTILHG
ncbi:MAG: GHMP kinase [Chloroflexota bacterium]|nr:GHMP kinase [Chloroflexota bacterium]